MKMAAIVSPMIVSFLRDEANQMPSLKPKTKYRNAAIPKKLIQKSVASDSMIVSFGRTMTPADVKINALLVRYVACFQPAT